MSTAFQNNRPILVDSELPAQSPTKEGNALITNGSTANWGNLLSMIGTKSGQVTPNILLNTVLPSQTGKGGQTLVTDGSNATWGWPATFDVFANGVASPLPGAFPTRSLRGFDAYSSTDFPAGYFVGLTVNGSGAGRDSQLAMGWNSEEAAPTEMFFRTNDDTLDPNAWSPWTQVITDYHFRRIPKSGHATPDDTDGGKMFVTTTGFTLPQLSAEISLSVYNNSDASITITPIAGLTLRQSGSTLTGARTLGPRGIARIWFMSSTEAIATGTT